MKNALIPRLALVLLLTLGLTTPSLNARDFNQVQVLGVDALAVTEAFELMKTEFSNRWPGLVIDWPAVVQSANGSWWGCYGPACIAENEDEYLAAMRQYTRENAHSLSVYINVDSIESRERLVLVIAHELSHHVLLLNGYGIFSHHSLICPLDKAYARALKLPTNDIHQGCQ